MSNLPDTPLSAYQAANLLEALKLVEDTGDWHGELRLKCEAILDIEPHPPNRRPGIVLTPEVGQVMAKVAGCERSAVVSAWRLCMIDGCWAYFARCAPTDVWGDDWNDAPHECNAGVPCDVVTLTVAYDGEWEIGGTQFCELNESDHPHGYSVEEINEGVMPWLVVPHGGDRWPEPRLRINAGVTLAEFTELIEQGGGRVYRSVEVPSA